MCLWAIWGHTFTNHNSSRGELCHKVVPFLIVSAFSIDGPFVLFFFTFRAFLADSPNFCIIWRMNSGFYLLAIYFFKYTFQQILYLFSISFKYYFFILFLFFLYSFLTAIFFKFPILIFFKFHNIFKFCSKKRTRGDIFFFFQLFDFVGWLQ